MVQNKFIILFLIMFGFLLCANIFAQNAAQLPAQDAALLGAAELPAEEVQEDLEAGYFIDISGETPRIIHRFVWKKEKYASHYEISIQVYKGYFVDFIIENTEKTFFEVSLPPGIYRYSIASFDLLDTRAAATPWKQFEVIATNVPQVKRFLPEAFYLDQEEERVLHIAGVNINENSKIYLSNDTDQLYPIKVTVINEERAVLVFDDAALIPGEYDIFILNPSGLGTRIGSFTIGYSKTFDIFIKAAYAPVIPIYGELRDLFGANLFLVGYSFGMEFVSPKRTNNINGGLELSASMFFLNNAVLLESSYADYMEGMKNAGNGTFLVDINLNGTFQKRLFINRFFLNFRGGLGMTYFSGSGIIQNNGTIMKLNLGFSAMYKIYKILHIDIGIDYSHYLTDDAFGLIRPKIGLVWLL